jgi:hypothetical protein
MIHERVHRIEFLDDIKFSKTIKVKVGLDRNKEWELTVKDLGLKANNNSISVATKEIRDGVREIHYKYLEGQLDVELEKAYSYYFNTAEKLSQNDKIKKLREDNKQKDLKVELLSVNGNIYTTDVGIFTLRAGGNWYKKRNKVADKNLLKTLKSFEINK